MGFEANIDGIVVKLKIKGYEAYNKEEWHSQWCECDYSFCSGEWLNYHKENDEILLSSEVEILEENLTKLLNDELEEITEVCFVEPDFIFKLHPKRDLRKDPNYAYVREGYEIEDIKVEWKIYFWYGYLTDNFLTVTLGRNEMVSLRDFLSSVIKN